MVVRGDSGFCREELMAWCEANRVEYLLGLAKNDRLKAAIVQEMGEAKVQYQQTGRAARLFKEFDYQTLKSWSLHTTPVPAMLLRSETSPRIAGFLLSPDAR